MSTASLALDEHTLVCSTKTLSNPGVFIALGVGESISAFFKKENMEMFINILNELYRNNADIFT